MSSERLRAVSLRSKAMGKPPATIRSMYSCRVIVEAWGVISAEIRTRSLQRDDGLRGEEGDDELVNTPVNHPGHWFTSPIAEIHSAYGG